MPRGYPTKPETIAKLKALIEQGHTRPQAAALTGLPLGQVDKLLVRREWAPNTQKRTPPDVIEHLRACLEDGYTYAEAGAELGLTKSQIAGLALRNGLTTNGAKTTLESRMAALHAMMDDVLERCKPTYVSYKKQSLDDPAWFAPISGKRKPTRKSSKP